MQDKDLEESAAWVKVPYRYNRAIVFDGILPHMSTRVDKLPSNMKRVIVGINFFDNKIGPQVSKCCIHSRGFKRAEKLRSTLNQVRHTAPCIYTLCSLYYCCTLVGCCLLYDILWL